MTYQIQLKKPFLEYIKLHSKKFLIPVFISKPRFFYYFSNVYSHLFFGIFFRYFNLLKVNYKCNLSFMKKIFLSLCFLTSFTFAQNTVTDYDGNSYNYLSYGAQQWTVENAAMETYRDGTPIPQVTDPTAWTSLTTGAWCYASNNSANTKLYNWYAVAGIHDNDPNTSNKELAPEGWHIPTDAEWTNLEEFLIANGYNYDGSSTGNKIAKAMASTTGWSNSTVLGVPGNTQASNNSTNLAFEASGYRHGLDGIYTGQNQNANFWASDQSNFQNPNHPVEFYSWVRSLKNNESDLIRYDNEAKDGFSVRFVKDEVISYCKEMRVTRLLDSNNEITTFEISTNEWHYLAFTKSSDLSGKIYLDGNLVGEGTFLDVNYNWSQLYLGVSYFTSWRKHFKGWLDEFRVSSIVRTEQEILENFEANTSLELDANTLGLWHLDEPDGNFFNNSVPGIDDGQLFSGAQFTNGRFGNAVYFDGVDDRGDCFTNIPESNVTFEIWLKIQGEEEQENVITPFEAYGLFNTSSDIFDNCN